MSGKNMTSAEAREEIILVMEELYAVFKLFNSGGRELEEVSVLIERIISRLEKVSRFLQLGKP